jgi:hypothetical protein
MFFTSISTVIAMRIRTHTSLQAQFQPPGYSELSEITLDYTLTRTTAAGIAVSTSGDVASVETTATSSVASASESAHNTSSESGPTETGENQPIETEDNDASTRPTVGIAVAVLVGAGLIINL